MPNPDTKAAPDEFDQAVTTAHAEAAGWGVNSFRGSNPFQSHFVYVCDYRHDEVNMFSVCRKDFDRIHLDEEPAVLATAVGELLKQRVAGTLDAGAEEAIGPILFGYIKATEVFSVWRRQAAHNEALHAVIHLYPRPSGGASVRPYIAKAQGSILTTDELSAAAMRVAAMDRVKHPEWFPPG